MAWFSISDVQVQFTLMSVLFKKELNQTEDFRSAGGYLTRRLAQR